MKNQKKYDELVKRFLSEYKITDAFITTDLVKVDIVPMKDGWGKCTFIFSGHYITCFGDVESYTWNCTWDTAKNILMGSCNASNFNYLSSKLEHKHKLMEFDFDEEVMKEVKEELSEDLDEDELEEFNERWDDNEYLLGDIDEYHLDKLDEFFDEMGIEDAYEYYHYFEDYPAHYYCAMAMLRCIEEHSKKETLL